MNPHRDDSGQGQAAPSTAPCCPQCAAQAERQFIYSLGRMELRFPTLGIEREFQQRESQLSAGRSERGANRWTRVAEVLSANDHLARAVCFVFLVGGLPAYIVSPSGAKVLDSMLQALRRHGEEGRWDLLIGRRGPMATPGTCAGLMVPMVYGDALYTFTLNEFLSELGKRAKPAYERAQIPAEAFETAARDLFERITASTENIGGLDSHRALNYLLVQHPGIFLAGAERAQTAILDSIETRVAEAANSRRLVTVILTFVDRATGVPERLFTRADVTEEWPFLADALQAGAAPMGLARYIDYGAAGSLV